ncbi:hypothetical protein LLEC1_03577 [Akanthomyces lecanii]|uniref:ABC transporter domain-containing protein n=1 Tax=Cordyceps confragosa TaxID=2714763 RepID=A0A179IN96_CORDF|nr:hypothetical protein LLEC1_03577 [Akanthomyces lecanii]
MTPEPDKQFGPQLAGHFDFTLLFEQAIFEIAPDSLLILATPFYLRSITGHAAKQVRAGPLLWTKLALATFLFAMYATQTALWQTVPADLQTSSAIASHVLALVASLCALVVLYSAHLYRKRPSAFISLFFSLKMLLDMALARSYFLRYESGFRSMLPIAAIQIVVVVLKLLLVILEEVPKTTVNRKGNPHSVVICDFELGFWGTAVFFSVNSLLLFGYKNDLLVENLPQLDDQFGSRVLYDAFFQHWRNLDRSGQFVLLRACLRTIIWKFFAMVIPRLCYAGFSLSRPFLIQRVLEFINSGGTTNQHPTGLIGATMLIYAGIAISRGVYERFEYQIKVSIRGVLTVALYDKMQRLSADDTQSAAAITLMTTDVMGVEQIIALLHEVWATCLEVAFGVYILYLFVDAACFLIFVPSILATASTYYSAKNMAKARGQWNERISNRVHATSTVLKQLKDIKAMGLSHSLSNLLQKKRKEEVAVSLRERRSRVIMFATFSRYIVCDSPAHGILAAFNLSMTPVVVLAGARFWTRKSPTMTVAEIFSAYAVILIISEPLDSLLERAIMWASSYACIERIQTYLALPEMDDTRLIIKPTEKEGDSREKTTESLVEKSNDIAVRMENVTVQSASGKVILKNINLSIPTGSLAMMHGTVGSGKSVFLQTLLGEMRPTEGKVSVPSTNISYAAQKPWIRNQTVRENVIGPNTVNESLYEEVIYSCALDIDLAELPNGDETMTGTDGCNLSGGQKQRLGLARSLYIDASTIILDDVLSSLDTTTAVTVFDRLFGPGGLLRRRGTTAIMTTNRLDLLLAGDVVFETMGDGTICERRGSAMPIPLETGAIPAVSTTSNDASATRQGEKRNTVLEPAVPSPDTTVNKLRRTGDFSLYIYLFRSAGPLLLSLWILSIAFASVAEKMPKIYVKIWYSEAPSNDAYFAGFAMTALANILITAMTSLFYFHMIVPNMSNELHWRLLGATVGATLSWITQTDTGTSLNRFSQDISIISQQLPIALVQFCFILCNTLVDVGIFASGAKYTAPIMLMLLFALYAVQYFYLRTSRQLRLLELETSAPLLTLFNEASSGIQHVRAFRWQTTFMQECCRLVDRMQKPYYSLLSVQQWLALVLDVSTCFIATILIAVSTTLPSSTSDTSIGLALINLVSFNIMAAALIRVWVTMETCLGGLARIRTFCATTPQETDGPNCSSVPEQWPLSGRIEIESISVSYEYEDGKLHQALDDVSIVIEHGEKAGISGCTGSGKSSLLSALLHMVECSGIIRIDGRDISTVPREILRSRITTLTQDGVEVEQSVRFNMYPFDECKPTDESILGILNLVGLEEHVQLQGGIDADMATMKFSPGQKQLFFVARGILHHQNVRSKIVMMDEATSSMEYGVDTQIQNLLDKQLKNCTLVLLAHRLHSLDNADVVVKLDAGKVNGVKRRSRAALPGQFDFTLVFEQSMLAIVPGGIITLLIPFYLRTAIRSPQHVRSGRLLWVKLAVGFILIAIQSSSLALWHGASLFRSNLALSAASMSLFASFGIVVILYVSHTHSLQPSAFLSVFLSLTMIFDIAMARSFFRRHGLGTIGALQNCVIILKLAIVVLEEVSKRTLFQAEQSRMSVSREGAAGFWNRATFTWLYPILSIGFCKELSLDDLPEIGEEFDCLRNFDDFSLRWTQADRTSSLALAKALVCTLPRQLARVILPRLFFVLLKFSQPFLLLHIVQAVKIGGVDRDVSWALVFITACVFVGITISGALQSHYHFRVMTIIRGILVVGIYDKMQKLGQEDLVSAAAVTLMTADTTGVEKVISLTYEVWSSSLQVALGLWSLYIFVGPACFLIARIAWNEDIQDRVAATSTVIAQIKEVKAIGMSQTVTWHLQEKRRKEIRTSMQDRHARLWMFAFVYVCHQRTALWLMDSPAAFNNCVTPVLVLGGAYFWTRVDEALSAAEVFTILAIVAIASQPLILILQGIMDWTVGFASLTRIQNFLVLRELEDARQEGDWQVRATEPVTEKDNTVPAITPFAIRIVGMGFTSLIRGPILRNINMQIPWGSLTMIWGPINCGKSTLLKTIVGESGISSGTVQVGTKLMAYCSQHPWIQNQTVQNTVIGVCEYVEYRYNEVIHSCALDVDILHMPQGDQTMTGTGGCNLSGGQKQRLSLARALYDEMEVLVLDDVLSALDGETATTIVGRLFGTNGLMRRWGRTVIMTTNRLEFLDYANLVYQMDLQGHIQLEERGGGDDDSASSSSATDSSTGQGEAEASADATPSTPLTPTQPPSVNPSADDTELKYARIPRQSGNWSLYTYYLLPAGLFWVISWVVVMAIAALIEKMPLIFVRIWYARDPSNPYYFVGFALFAVASIFCNTVMGMHFFFKILPKSAEKIHSHVVHSVVFFEDLVLTLLTSATLDFLSQTDAGFLLSRRLVNVHFIRFSRDMTFVAQELPMHFLQFAFLFFTVIYEVGIVATGTAYTIPIMTFILVALYAIQVFYLRTSRQLRLLELESSESLFAHFTETSDGIQHIRSAGWEDEFLAQLYHRLSRSQKPYYLLFCVQQWLSYALDSTATVSAVVLTYLSLFLPHATTDNAVGLALLTLVTFSSVGSFLIRAWTNLETTLGAVARIKDFCANAPLEQDTLRGPELPENWPTTGLIDFNGVGASYTAEDGSVRRALDNVTFTIQPGDKVGISGRTGSGKSSIFLALLRMVKFSGGISIDGRDITTIPRELLRSRITTMSQDGVELYASVRFNIYPFSGPQPEEDTILATLQLVGLWDHIEKYGGIEDAMSNMCFSASQRQLFFLARAMVHQRTANTTIVLVDEATSAMSKESDEQTRALMSYVFSECVVLHIAHHQDWLTDVNVKIRMDFGGLVSVQRRRRNGQWMESQ